MNIQEIKALWEVDCKINDAYIDIESAKISELFYRYQNILFLETENLKKIEQHFSRKKLLLYKYYNGWCTKEELETLGRTQWSQETRKGDINLYLEADVDYQHVEKVLWSQQHLCKYVEQIISILNKRSFDLKNIIEYRKWTGGMN